MMSRPDWDVYFLEIAKQVATRATCDRLHVGAVLVRDRNILSTGFNGAVRGLPHCDDVGHDIVDTHCVRTVHAESNAIAQAARHGVRVDGATLYCTAFPCWLCFRLLVQAGIAEIVFDVEYRPDPRVETVCRTGRIKLRRLGEQHHMFASPHDQSICILGDK